MAESCGQARLRFQQAYAPLRTDSRLQLARGKPGKPEAHAALANFSSTKRATFVSTSIPHSCRVRSVIAQARRISPSGESSTEEKPATASVNTEHGGAFSSYMEHWLPISGWLFLLGFALGPPLDGIHSVTGLQVYQGPAAVYIGGVVHGLPTSLWVFPLLGLMYSVVGLLQLCGDAWLCSRHAGSALPPVESTQNQLPRNTGVSKEAMSPTSEQSQTSSSSLQASGPGLQDRPAPPPPTPTASGGQEQSAPQVPPLVASVFPTFSDSALLLERPPAGSWLRVLSSLAVLIGLLRLSSLLFEDSTPSHLIFATLSVCAHGNWLAFDRTLPGYLLAALLAVGAPLSEALLIGAFGLWEYSQPDYFVFGQGLVSWTSWCYFFYTQWIGTLVRALQASYSAPSKVKKEMY